MASDHWLLVIPVFPSLQLAPPDFVTTLRVRLGLFDHSVCTCGLPMDALRTHLLQCSHGGERMDVSAHIRSVAEIRYNDYNIPLRTSPLINAVIMLTEIMA